MEKDISSFDSFRLILRTCVCNWNLFFLENGQLIVTVLPTNSKYPWITPARFRPELVPEELMAPELSVREFFN